MPTSRIFYYRILLASHQSVIHTYINPQFIKKDKLIREAGKAASHAKISKSELSVRGRKLE